MNNPDLRPVFRCHFRGLLAAEPAPAHLETIKAEAAAAIRAGRLMTAACYRFGSELFLFCEALGEPCSPEALLPAFNPLLAPWPQNGELRRWAVMYNIYWHSVPKNAADWRRPAPPALRRGRIARLQTDKLFSYCYHHTAIVQEGLLQGDRYHSIALHENTLFSYFEEPKTMVNIRGVAERPSPALAAWEAADPESHFIRLPGAAGNFLFLPTVFAFGQESV